MRDRLEHRHAIIHQYTQNIRYIDVSINSIILFLLLDILILSEIIMLLNLGGLRIATQNIQYLFRLITKPLCQSCIKT